MYSVIISSIGRFKYLDELLQSIESQTLKPLEVILLLDDNEHCRNGVKELPHRESLRVVFCHALNLPQKRNYGAQIASSEKILFSDDDDIWHASRGEAVFAALEFSSACCHNYSKFGSVIGESLNPLGTKDRDIYAWDLLRGSNIFGGGSSIAARKSLVNIFPFRDEFVFCEDFDWWVRIISAGVRVHYLGASLVSYRVHSTNITRSRLQISKFSIRIAKRLALTAFVNAISSMFIFIRSIVRLSNILIGR